MLIKQKMAELTFLRDNAHSSAVISNIERKIAEFDNKMRLMQITIPK